MKMSEDRVPYDVPGENTRTPARRSDPETSQDSARAILSKLAPKQAMVLRVIVDRFSNPKQYSGGTAAFELEERLGAGSWWKRLSELHEAGLIQTRRLSPDLTPGSAHSVERFMKRVAPSGMRQLIWFPTEDGIEWVRRRN